MNSLTVVYGDQVLTVEVRRADRATLDISVSPDGDVLVIAPLAAELEAIGARVRTRARWILEQQRYFAQFRPRTPARRWVPGETHRYLGRQYRLRIGVGATSTQQVRRVGDFLLMDGIEYDDTVGIERVVRAWYRARTREVITRRLPDCVALFRAPVAPGEVTVRSMTSRWASMSSAGRLTVNPDLVRAPTDAIDYVLVHELAHRIAPDHGPRFAALLDDVMPDHRLRKNRLERAAS
ncbi:MULTISPECIES: M48 family metallopeptidase [Bacteria]